MTSIDLSPLYRSSVGFDRFGSLLDTALRSNQTNTGYPPYNIEVLDENHYEIALAVAGFHLSELDIQTESGVLTVRGRKDGDESESKEYLHKGIATRAFERKFNLADYVEVTQAKLENGLLYVKLEKQIPDAMKPKTIAIDGAIGVLEDKGIESVAA